MSANKNNSAEVEKVNGPEGTVSEKAELENGQNEQPFGRPEWELLQKRTAILYDNLRSYHTNLQQLLADTQQEQGKKNSG